jgi:hypothetical protein
MDLGWRKMAISVSTFGDLVLGASGRPASSCYQVVLSPNIKAWLGRPPCSSPGFLVPTNVVHKLGIGRLFWNAVYTRIVVELVRVT